MSSRTENPAPSSRFTVRSRPSSLRARRARQERLLARFDALDLEMGYHAEFRARARLGPETLGEMKRGTVFADALLDSLEVALDWAEAEFATVDGQPKVGRTMRALNAARAALVEGGEALQQGIAVIDQVVEELKELAKKKAD
jgi:hypothetical protein